MTKAQLVTKLAEAGGVNRKQADQMLDFLTETVVKSVKKGESVKIPGLGIFRLRKMKARMGRNPQTGEPIKIPARKKVGFSVAKVFKESVLGQGQVGRQQPTARERVVVIARPREPSRGGTSDAPHTGKGFRMIRQATFLAVAVAALSGCATVVHGPYQDVMIDSNPPGAQATVTAQLSERGPLFVDKEKQTVTTPATVRLRRDNNYRIELEKPGYKVATTQVVSAYDWLWAPVSCGPCEAVGALPTYDMSDALAARPLRSRPHSTSTRSAPCARSARRCASSAPMRSWAMHSS